MFHFAHTLLFLFLALVRMPTQSLMVVMAVWTRVSSSPTLSCAQGEIHSILLRSSRGEWRYTTPLMRATRGYSRAFLVGVQELQKRRESAEEVRTALAEAERTRRLLEPVARRRTAAEAASVRVHRLMSVSSHVAVLPHADRDVPEKSRSDPANTHTSQNRFVAP